MPLAYWFWLFVAASILSWAFGIYQTKYGPYALFPWIIPIVILGMRVFGSAVH